MANNNAYVPVPRDLSRMKNKVALGLTKRQLLCFGIAAVLGAPTYFATKGFLGGTGSILLMMLVMLPAFFVAMYEKDGQAAEKIFRNTVRCKYIMTPVRPYKAKNLYAVIENFEMEEIQHHAKKRKTNAQKRGQQSQMRKMPQKQNLQKTK